MNPEANHTGRFRRRTPEHVCKVRIECDEDAILFDRRSPHILVVRTREADFYHGYGVVAQIADSPRVERRQVLVQQEFHASESTTSSAANAAAYPRQARRSSDVSCG